MASLGQDSHLLPAGRDTRGPGKGEEGRYLDGTEQHV